MRGLPAAVTELRTDEDTRKQVEERLESFRTFKEKEEDEWFSELCFCLLAANAKGATAAKIQEELGKEKLLTLDKEELSQTIRGYGHRFHNTKASYIAGARKHEDLKETITGLAKEDSKKARDWLAKNIKGIGMKEASHYLRNTGHDGVAIIDRHVKALMEEHGHIRTNSKALTPTRYLALEKTFTELARKAGMTVAEFDLYCWRLKAGTVLK
ncbi:N-glycosylase/DNA lyase [Candidatus Woesearchaeota archaeon]|nr:N-glycosylase/DNA lyase [Candidatus Woesearchaeota archaeon]